MAAQKTTKKNKPTPVKNKKLPGNRKAVVLVAFIAIFIGIGGFWYYRQSSAAVQKSVQDCRYIGVTIQRGSKGACVKVAQKTLKAIYGDNNRAEQRPATVHVYFACKDLVLDGNFGPATDHCVKTYQGYKRISADGIVGDQTWSRLQADCEALGSWSCSLVLGW